MEKTSDINSRVLYIIDRYGLSQAKFAKKVGISSANLCRGLKSEKGLSTMYLKRIADSTGYSLDWLRTGEGSMLRSAEDRLLDMVDEERMKSVMQQFGGHHNQQTMQQAGTAAQQDTKQEVALLRKMVEDKDKEIEFLRKMLEQMSGK